MPCGFRHIAARSYAAVQRSSTGTVTTTVHCTILEGTACVPLPVLALLDRVDGWRSGRRASNHPHGLWLYVIGRKEATGSRGQIVGRIAWWTPHSQGSFRVAPAPRLLASLTRHRLGGTMIAHDEHGARLVDVPTS